MVYRLALVTSGGRVADAEDITQDVFLRMIAANPHFNDAEHAKAWLLRTTINRCRSYWTRASRRHETPVDMSAQSEEYVPTHATARHGLGAVTFDAGGGGHAAATVAVTAAVSGADPAELACAAADGARVRDAVNELPPKQRLCIHLFYFEDLSIERIAVLTGWRKSTIRSHLHRGRAALRAALGKDFADELS